MLLVGRGGDFKSQHVIFHFCPSLDDASVDPGAMSEQDAQDTPAPCRVSEAHPPAEHRGLGLFVPATEPGLPWLTHSGDENRSPRHWPPVAT